MIEFYLHGFGSHAADFASHWTQEFARDSVVFLDGPESDKFTRGRRWFPFTANANALREGIEAGARFATVEIHKVMKVRGLDLGSPIEIVGHSQGAMVALELVRRRQLNICMSGCYCGYLPEVMLESIGHARIDTELEVYSSAADQYVPVQAVLRTVGFFRTIPGVRVRHFQTSKLAHTFSREWLETTNFQLAGSI